MQGGGGEVDGWSLGSALRLVALGPEEGEGEVDAFGLTGPALGFGTCSAVEEVFFQFRAVGRVPRPVPAPPRARWSTASDSRLGR
ncbi:hypothetical protein C7M71_025500 [Peterkaempfera bronchialis]|uniref:Uncharacterized protein n=1 Tax=Peterkaempfera bronchialis TaxID=2126346 RepID=A0A345T2P7_9ACTN|nr:hypothetical protein C7M71_025500 [Peterkaempfera bronchialis]